MMLNKIPQEMDYSNYTAPVVAIATVSITTTIISVFINAFILLFTLCNHKILKNPGIIFLTNFIVANLFLAVVYIPSVAVSVIAGGWIYGSNDEERYGTCQFMGFMIYCYNFITVFTITVISIDRFLFIAKPLIHKKYMQTWVAVVILVSIWIMAGIFCQVPFFGIGAYWYNGLVTSCIISYANNRMYVISGYAIQTACVIIIIGTTVATYCFVKNFINRLRQPTMDESIYTRRKNKVIGVFGTLLIVTLIIYLPPFLVGLLSITIGFRKLPLGTGYVSWAPTFLNTMLNPAVQVYFRKEIQEAVLTKMKTIFQKLKQLSCKRQNN